MNGHGLHISNSILMPSCAIGISLYVGWVWANSARKEVTNQGQVRFGMMELWLMSLRFFAPIAIGVILINGIK